MITLSEQGVYYLGGETLLPDDGEAEAALAAHGIRTTKEAARDNTMAWQILRAHNEGEGEALRVRFDALISHDITFVGIIQTARASGLTEFPVPYVLTNCHNSLCAVGGTINEDDHLYGLTAAKRYGGVYVPPHLAVIHQYARERMATCGGMILGSDSHTRYGALGTLAMGEGGPELVKQLLRQTYDIRRPEVVGIYLTGSPVPGVGPQDVALAVIGAVFANGFVKNRVMEFFGPGLSSLSADFRIGIDVMTTETACLSSIWETDAEIERFYEIHGRKEAYRPLSPGTPAYYDGVVRVDLSAIRPMIAMPFHPSNVYTVEEVCQNPADILHETEEKAKESLGGAVPYVLSDKLRDGKVFIDQGIIAGCAGGGFENLCAAAEILRGHSVGSGRFSLSVYPASVPVYMELVKNGCAAALLEAGAIVKTAFCGPCFGAGDTPANGALSIRHTTRNFPNREGSKLQSGQIASVALMDARSIAATAARQGVLTPATALACDLPTYGYRFDAAIYDRRVFDSHGQADAACEVQFGPNIKDWPKMPPLPENLVLQIVSEIHDALTTTDELIPSGETSSYRSNPLGLAEFTLSRKDPAYVGRAKAIRRAEEALTAGECAAKAVPDLQPVIRTVKAAYPEVHHDNIGFGSAIYATKPGDGSAREQAASCQRVLGGWANLAAEYATKRYRSNLINWGMLPFVVPEGALPFANLDYLFFPGIRTALTEKKERITGYVVRGGELLPFAVTLGELTDEERQILLAGCLINYNRRGR